MNKFVISAVVVAIIGFISFLDRYINNLDEITKQLNTDAAKSISNINEHVCSKELQDKIDLALFDIDEETDLHQSLIILKEKNLRNIVKYEPYTQCALQNHNNIASLAQDGAKQLYLKNLAGQIDTLLNIPQQFPDEPTDCEKAMVRIQLYCPEHLKNIQFDNPFLKQNLN